MTPPDVPPSGVPLDRRGLQNRAASGALWTIIHVLVSLPLAFGVNIMLARVLGLADYGRLAYLTMIMEIAAVVVTAGVGAGLIQYGAKAHAMGDIPRVQSLLSRSQGFRLLVGAPVLSLIVIRLADVPVALLILALVFGIWVPAGFGGATASLTIQNETARAARLAMAMNVLSQAVVIAVVLTLATPDAVWGSRLVMAGAGVVAAIFLVRAPYRQAVLRPRLPRGMPNGFWRFAIPMGLSGIIATLALSRSEVVLLEHLSTAEQVGLYAMAFGLAGHLFAPAQALLTPLTPAVSALREVDVTAIRSAFLRTTRVSGTLGGVIVSMGAPSLALLVPILYGKQFEVARELVLALTIVSGFLVLSYPMQSFVTARLRSGSTLAVNSMSLAATILVALALIPWIGAWGAVLGKVAVVLTRVGWLLWREPASFMVSRLEFLGTFRTTTVASFAAIAAFFAGDRVVDLSGSALLGSSGSLIFGALAYLVLLRLVHGGLQRNDIAAIQRALPIRFRALISWATKPLRSHAGSSAPRRPSN
ncbi:oligosaccharide flippase family protein [Ornithinimicrobium ciconiae]|nr:oligosaccharide flippase family protein [Ornithinimicrobium ciconiae]